MSYTIYEIIAATFTIMTGILAAIFYIGWLDATYELSVLNDKKIPYFALSYAMPEQLLLSLLD